MATQRNGRQIHRTIKFSQVESRAFKKFKAVLPIVLMIIINFISTGCNSTEEIQAGDTSVLVMASSSEATSSSVELPPGPPAVCNPLMANVDPTALSAEYGVWGQLRYLPNGVPPFKNVAAYKSSGTLIDVDLFLSELNVPTRSFSLGFITQGGEVIKNHQGNTLYEYFSLSFESQLKLSEDDPIGPYQFALLSDDGAVLQMDTGAGYSSVIDNDGDHSSRFLVSSQPITFNSRSTTFPIRVDYYQGPRFHIALVLLWRPWPTTSSGALTNGSDAAHNKSGNSLFFDFNKVPSAPTATYNSILSRGWKPIPAKNFLLPPQFRENPCSQPVSTSIVSANPSSSATTTQSISISFSSNSSAATFVCSLDGGVTEACTSPKTYMGLADGNHYFVVYASANGKTDATGASYSWTVDTVAPRILGYTVTPTTNSFTVVWTTDEPTTTSLIWGPGNTLVTTTLEDSQKVITHTVTVTGLNSFQVYSFKPVVRDSAGNVSNSATYRIQTE